MAEAAGSDDEELAVAELAVYCESREEREGHAQGQRGQEFKGSFNK